MVAANARFFAHFATFYVVFRDVEYRISRFPQHPWLVDIIFGLQIIPQEESRRPVIINSFSKLDDRGQKRRNKVIVVLAV